MTKSLPVFIVEDSTHMQSALRDLVQAVGPFHVVGAASGETQATDWLAQHRSWELAIVDLMLEDGSGFSLLQRFRTTHPEGKVVVFSEFASPAVKQRCCQLGADAAFLKSEMESLVHFLEGAGLPSPAVGDDFRHR